MSISKLKNIIDKKTKTITKTVTVKLNGKFEEVIIKKKNMRSLRIKLDNKGQIIFSMPLNYSVEKAVKFLKEKEDWISEHKIKIANNTPSNCSFLTGSTVYYFGKPYIIITKASKKEQCEIGIDTITLFTKLDTSENNKKIFLSFIYKNFYDYSLEKMKEYHKDIFKPLEIPIPTLNLKLMKSMWGNCKYLKGIITLNLYLAKQPTEQIDYVILHELTHLIHHNHGKGFKNFLSRYMPNWKIIKQKLNNCSLNF